MPSERAKLDAKAWKLFARCVRLGAANSNGQCECYTCGGRQHWKKMHAGHWQGRGKKPTKFHVDNVRTQCSQCNNWGSSKLHLQHQPGEPLEFERRLMAEGIDTDALKLLADSSGYRSVPFLEDLVEELTITLQLTVASAIKRGVMDAKDALK